MRRLTEIVVAAVAVRVVVLVSVVTGGVLTTKHEQALDTSDGRFLSSLMEVHKLAKVGNTRSRALTLSPPVVMVVVKTLDLCKG